MAKIQISESYLNELKSDIRRYEKKIAEIARILNLPTPEDLNAALQANAILENELKKYENHSARNS